MSYYAARGKLPGDPTNSGEIGANSQNYGYDFENDANYKRYLRASEAVFFDLDKEGIMDYDIDNLDFDITKGGKMSNVIKNTFYRFAYADDNYEGNYQKGFNSNVLDLTSKYDGFIFGKIALAIDEKMDDGLYDSGSIRGLCTENIDIEDGYGNFDGSADATYKQAIDSKNGGCDEMNFKLDV